MDLYFYIVLFLIAFLYASVGHGGASGYLALMAILNFSPAVMKPTALLLNVCVSLFAFVQYYRKQYFVMKLFIPLAMASIPMAYVGGLMTIDGYAYKKILGVLLLIPIVRLMFFGSKNDYENVPYKIPLAIAIGAVIGLLSGLIGIGGGILLSPLLIMLRWTDMKQTAAISAIFIFVNSIAGLIGQLNNDIVVTVDMWTLAVVASMGGILGAYYGATKFNHAILKYALAIVLIIASYKLLLTTA